MDSPAAQDEAARRTFLAQLISGCMEFLAAFLGIPPVGATVGPALEREETNWLVPGDPDVHLPV